MFSVVPDSLKYIYWFINKCEPSMTIGQITSVTTLTSTHNRYIILIIVHKFEFNSELGVKLCTFIFNI